MNLTPRRARSLNFPPFSTATTVPSRWAPAGIAVRPSTVTSRETRAVTRSSILAVADDRAVSRRSPMTAFSPTVSSSNRGLAGGGGGRGSGVTVAGGSGGESWRPVRSPKSMRLQACSCRAWRLVPARQPAEPSSPAAPAPRAAGFSRGALRLISEEAWEFDAAAGAFRPASALLGASTLLGTARPRAGLAGGSTATDVPITAGGTGACPGSTRPATGAAASAATGRFAAFIRRAIKLPAPAATTVAAPRAVTTSVLVDITLDLQQGPYLYSRSPLLGRL